MGVTHTDLRACPFCGAALRIRNSVNAYGQCETEGCWMNARKVIVPLDDPRQVSGWNTRARTPDSAPSQNGDLIARAHAECRELEGVINHTTMFEFIDALRAAEAREQKLREALTFYADRHNWRSVTVPMCGCVGESSVTNDSGERARRALGGSNET